MMADRYTFSKYMRNEASKSPTDPNCKALPFLWGIIRKEMDECDLQLNSLPRLMTYAEHCTLECNFTREQLWRAAALLWHRYVADLWVVKKIYG